MIDMNLFTRLPCVSRSVDPAEIYWVPLHNSINLNVNWGLGHFEVSPFKLVNSLNNSSLWSLPTFNHEVSQSIWHFESLQFAICRCNASKSHILQVRYLINTVTVPFIQRDISTIQIYSVLYTHQNETLLLLFVNF